MTDVIGWNVWDDGCVDVKDLKDQTIHTIQGRACWTFWNVEDEARQGGAAPKKVAPKEATKKHVKGRATGSASASTSTSASSRFQSRTGKRTDWGPR